MRAQQSPRAWLSRMAWRRTAGEPYATDSILGAIYRFVPSQNNALSMWVQSPLLLSHNPNLLPGANDLAFDAGQDFLYVNQAGDRRVFRVPYHADGTPGDLELFADGATLDQQLGLPSPTALYYADGMQFDVKGNLYLMANRRMRSMCSRRMEN